MATDNPDTPDLPGPGVTRHPRYGKNNRFTNRTAYESARTRSDRGVGWVLVTRDDENPFVSRDFVFDDVLRLACRADIGAGLDCRSALPALEVPRLPTRTRPEEAHGNRHSRHPHIGWCHRSEVIYVGYLRLSTRHRTPRSGPNLHVWVLAVWCRLPDWLTTENFSLDENPRAVAGVIDDRRKRGSIRIRTWCDRLSNVSCCQLTWVGIKMAAVWVW